MEGLDFSPAALVASFLVSTVGLGFFLYGKKQARLPQLATGLAMMIFPYFAPGADWMLGIGAALVAGLWVGVRAGY